MSGGPKNVRDVHADVFIPAFAKHLKAQGKTTLPKWSTIVKTATWKEYSPYDNDWLYVRMAALARRIYLHKGLGLGALRREFGGRRRNGTRPEHRALATAGNLRWCLQELERLGLVEAEDAGGRRIPTKGVRDIDTVASSIKA